MQSPFFSSNMWVISAALHSSAMVHGYPNNAPFCWPGYPSAIYEGTIPGPAVIDGLVATLT
jgi:hypothetical protein